MPIPEFTEFGLLPPGHFDVTRAEIADRYLHNPNRADIWQQFEKFAAELQAQPWGASVDAFLLDGGFTSDKPSTKDIDVVLDLSKADDPTLYEACFWIENNRTRLMTDFRVDPYPYHPKISNDLRSFFTYVKSDDCVRMGAPLQTRKGLLVLKS